MNAPFRTQDSSSLMIVGTALALLLGGGGRASIDRAIAESNR